MRTVHVLRSLFSVAGVSLSLALFAYPAGAAHTQSHRGAEPVPAIYVGKRKIRAPAFVDHHRLLVPVRGVFEAIDANVEYSWPNFVVVRKDGAVIAAFILDRQRAIVGHEAVDLDVAPMRRDGRVYVPLRVVAEAAGASVAYTNRPPAVHIRPSGAAAIDPVATVEPTGISDAAETSPVMPWRIGVAVVTGLCCLGCLVLTARRFAPNIFRASSMRVAPVPARVPPMLYPVAPDRVALTSVEATGEARFHKQIVTETRTIKVPVTREELVIEYAGEGGTVIIQGRQLAAGETVRIPLWEERVQVDVTKHVLLKEDIVVDKRRSTVAAPAPQRSQPGDFSVVEGSPS